MPDTLNLIDPIASVPKRGYPSLPEPGPYGVANLSRMDTRKSIVKLKPLQTNAGPTLGPGTIVSSKIWIFWFAGAMFFFVAAMVQPDGTIAYVPVGFVFLFLSARAAGRMEYGVTVWFPRESVEAMVSPKTEPVRPIRFPDGDAPPLKVLIPGNLLPPRRGLLRHRPLGTGPLARTPLPPRSPGSRPHSTIGAIVPAPGGRRVSQHDHYPSLNSTEIGIAIRAFRAELCPACNEAKLRSTDMFCEVCMGMLPPGLQIDLADRDNFVESFHPAMKLLESK